MRHRDNRDTSQQAGEALVAAALADREADRKEKG
jgi:hypothetical protein